VVDEVTIPMRGDRRMRLAFHRSPKPHQEVIDSRWAVSQGTCQYLGEWHTHPEFSPTPSSTDLSDWRRRLSADQFEGDSLLFVIVGICEVRVWEGFRSTQVIHLLQLARTLGPLP
jgi:integrative and conjugative element protein (TIGR02256 family)